MLQCSAASCVWDINDTVNGFISEDLWEYLGKASGKPVADVMTSWTKQMGFPVLSVTAQQVCKTKLSNKVV